MKRFNSAMGAIMNGADLKADGMVCLDAQGNIAMPFNTKGMYRGYIKSDEKPITMIYKNK
ncbi:MAG: isoaspartyl peptidase/L-asparaginase [Candidatus Marinimicrobia bacterium]|jgi:isoaspartyl peptidase/L-asparaginase-like protein (Ntn-hydrolase superfamily)|nr:isoaspartyl peptidase/L-asparaginase [Candidatus Neomarinimicrobiota bacterium]|tara:strand:+ start:13083 stop:13262 length:180 start_codon:yes stop_codon:yes gene_type:complete